MDLDLPEVVCSDTLENPKNADERPFMRSILTLMLFRVSVVIQVELINLIRLRVY